MTRRFCTSLAAALGLACSGAGHGAYSGLYVEEIDDFSDVWTPDVQEYFDTHKLTMYRVYAEALVPVDITAIVGTPDAPMYLAGDVFQSPIIEHDFGPPSLLSGFEDPLIYLDSWFTIASGENVLLDPVLGAQSFENGWGTTNGGYFTPPGGTGLGDHTLLFQITLEPGKSAELQFNVHVQDEGLYTEHLVLNSNYVPNPGVLWVLGAAGLLSRRRR